MITKILVALHPGMLHTPAIERVKAITQNANLEVKLYSSVHTGYSSGSSFANKNIRKEFLKSIVDAQTKVLQKVASELSDITNSTEIEVDWDLPTAAGIISASNTYGADLIVMSSTRHNQVARWFMTNTDWEVLRTATIPVLLAHHRAFRPYKTILAAVDPTHMRDEPAKLDHKIIQTAEMIATWSHGSLHLGHAFPSQKTQIEIDYIPPPELVEQWRKEHTTAIRKLAARYNIPIEQQHLLDEFPIKAIPDIAIGISAELVVLGVVSRSHVKQLWVGQTTEHLLDRLQCDILTTPPVK